VPDTDSNPIGQIGFNISSNEKKEGEVILNYVNFEGEPKQIFKRPDHVENYQRGKEKKEGYYGEIWRNAWVQSLDKWEKRGKNFRICQNNGRGILFTGTDLWRNYSIASNIMLQSSNSGGIVSRVQGVNKYYTFEICKGNKLRIGKMNNDYQILKEEEFEVEFFKEYKLKISNFRKDELIKLTQDYSAKSSKIGKYNVIIETISLENTNESKEVASNMVNNFDVDICILFSNISGKTTIVGSTKPSVDLDISIITNDLSSLYGGGASKDPNLSIGGGPGKYETSKAIDVAIKSITKLL